MKTGKMKTQGPLQAGLSGWQCPDKGSGIGESSPRHSARGSFRSSEWWGLVSSEQTLSERATTDEVDEFAAVEGCSNAGRGRSSGGGMESKDGKKKNDWRTMNPDQQTGERAGLERRSNHSVWCAVRGV